MIEGTDPGLQIAEPTLVVANGCSENHSTAKHIISAIMAIAKHSL